MAGREVKEYTNLSDARDKKLGSKGEKEKTDDEDVAFKRMVAKIRCRRWLENVAGIFMDEEAGPFSASIVFELFEDVALWGGTTTALDSDDLLYLKEQMEAEEDAERLRRRTEKRALLHLKHKAASLVDSLPAPVLQPLRVEPKPHTGIRQQVLVKSIVEIKRKRHRISGPTEGTSGLDSKLGTSNPLGDAQVKVPESSATKDSREQSAGERTNGGGILGLAYESSDDEESEPGPKKDLGKVVSAQSTAVSKSTSMQ